MKFYNVKVGTRTRAGNLNVNHSFVAQSERNQNEVYSFYGNKYKGLAIEVEEITEIVSDEIPVEVKKDYFTGVSVDVAKIRALEKEIQELKEKGVDRFSSTVIWNNITDEITEKFKEFQEIYKQYATKKGEIRSLIRAVIFAKYPMVKIDNVSIEEFNHDVGKITYTIQLDGTLKY